MERFEQLADVGVTFKDASKNMRNGIKAFNKLIFEKQSKKYIH